MSTDSVLLSHVARAAGVTYRQADHWCRKGYINAPLYGGWDYSIPAEADQHSGGTGYLRRLTAREARIFHLVARLVRAGVKPKQAAVLARVAIEGDHRTVVVAPGLTLTIREAT